jgi:hypothetical protein
VAFGIQYVVTYLLDWSTDYKEETKWHKLLIYAGMNAAYALAAALRAVTILNMGLNLSKKIHSQMVYRLLHSEVSRYLEKTSQGDILSRFG